MGPECVPCRVMPLSAPKYGNGLFLSFQMGYCDGRTLRTESALEGGKVATGGQHAGVYASLCVTPLSAPRREAAVALLLVALLWRTDALHVVGFRGPCRTLARDDPSLVLMSLLVCQIVCKSGQRDSIPWLSTQKHGGRTEEVWALGRGDPHGSTLPSRVISCRSAREGCFPPCNRQATMGTGTSKRRTPRRENRGVWIEHEKKSHQVCLR